jgi:hypothetical protein
MTLIGGGGPRLHLASFCSHKTPETVRNEMENDASSDKVELATALSLSREIRGVSGHARGGRRRPGGDDRQLHACALVGVHDIR